MKFVPMTDEQIAKEEVMDEYAHKLEEEWRRPRLKAAELRVIFPEIMQIAPIKIKEIEAELAEIKKRHDSTPITGNQIDVWWEEDRRDGEIDVLKKQLNRFKRFIPDEHNGNGVSDDQIESARDVPILDIVDEPRRSGSRYVMHCPMHEERTPSCVIYPKSNDFWCFGCNKGGDTIDLVMAQDDVDFITAVKRLTGVS